MNKYKLTPDYYIRRALKSTTLAELTQANVGLHNLFWAHWQFNMQRFLDSCRLTNSQK